MSRREGRDSQGKRLHSRSEREPSPRKPRRDGKPATERTHSSSRHLDIADTTDRSHKQRRRLQDALPLEVPPAPVKTVQPDPVRKDLDKKAGGLPDGTKNSSVAMEVPQPQSHFQHDERGSAGQGGLSFGRKSTDHGKWSDLKEQYSDRARDRGETHELQRKYEKTQSSADDKKVWRHDRFYELEAEGPPLRKRPAFSEKKMPAEPVSEPVRLPRDQGGPYRSTGLDRRPFIGVDERNGRRGEGPLNRAEMQWPSYQSRERFRGEFTRGRDRIDGRFSERSTDHLGGVEVEKWKHDMFDEANRSPTPKNEDEQIAKVEALLAL